MEDAEKETANVGILNDSDSDEDYDSDVKPRSK